VIPKMQIKGSLIPGKMASDYVEGMLQPENQVKSWWVELTLKQVYILEEPGNLDFSGKELKAGKLKKYPKMKMEGDAYGWWTLGGGSYVIEFNEKISLPENSYALLSPSPNLVINEASHPTMVIHPGENISHTTLSVGPPGVNLKENAIISRLTVTKF